MMRRSFSRSLTQYYFIGGGKAESRSGKIDVRARAEKKDHSANGPQCFVSHFDNKLHARHTDMWDLPTPAHGGIELWHRRRPHSVLP